ncbi:MAG TPA: hypothetical protein VN759_00815 [Pseudolysinimonas sp.]|nr:hypothetical protein [Pseudolysinimonas sp.]
MDTNATPHEADQSAAEDQPEKEAIEHTEETGEILPSSNWPQDSGEVKSPA